MPVRIPLDRHDTVVSVLREAARANADVEAYVEPAGERERRALTFAQWDQAADGVAGYLARRGVAKGDVVCVVLPSCIDYAVLYAALQRLGAITSGINPRLGAAEVASILDRASPALIVADPEAAPLPDAPGVDLVERAEIGAEWSGSPPERWPDLGARDPVALVWTSGTTGHPKGALFDHANLAAVAGGTDVLSRPGDRRLSPLPFAHVAYMTRAWDEIAHGVTTVITPTPWRAGDALGIMGREGVSVGQGVPTQWALMLANEELERTDLSSLRVVGTGAARMASAMVGEVRRRFGVPVVVRYTSTEASLGTGTALDSSDEEVATTVGRPVPGVELAVVGDDGRAVATGSVGRVMLRSAAVMRGYWGRGPGRGRAVRDLLDHEATASVLSPDGWLTTGDFGLITPEGNLQLSGRTHERYIRGGYNVYPAEVEEALAAHASVDRSAVVGVPDDVLGEIGVAVVVAAAGVAPDLAELRAHCASRLSDYKAPDGLVVVEELPLTPMMKVDTVRVRALAAEAAEDRRSRLAPRRGGGTGMVGRGPDRHRPTTEASDEKERA